MNDQDFAIVIGINNYPQLPLLKGAIRDAIRFKDWLLSADGGHLPESNVRLIISPDVTFSDPYDALPVKIDIDRALRDFGLDQVVRDFVPGATDDDSSIQPLGRRLYFYFSGHGVGPNFDEIVMLMANASLTALNNNAGMRPYRSLLKRLALFEECVFIMDCCRDPILAITPAEPALSIPPTFTFGPCHPVEDFVIMAADWGSKALERTITEDEQTNRFGVLTNHFVNGLRDPEAADANGRITSETMRRYLLGRMTNGQTPKFILPSGREILFATIPRQQVPTIAVRIVAPAGLTGQLVLSDGEFNEIDRQPADQLTAAGAAWVVNLEKKRLYSLDHAVNGQLVKSVMLDLRKVTTQTYDFPFSNV